MNHTEAVEQMAAEGYLLGELAPDIYEAFEEHLFDCPECALDLRVGGFFIDDARAELPSIPDKQFVAAKTPKSKSSSWFVWLRPAFAAPAFAVLMAVVVFQNAVTFPKLREAAMQPRLVPLSHLRPATRGASHLTLTVDRMQGAILQADLPAEGTTGSGEIAATSYALDLRDSQDKPVWSATMPASGGASDQDQQFSVYLPGATLRNGAYTLSVIGVDAQGRRALVGEYLFDIVVSNQ